MKVKLIVLSLLLTTHLTAFSQDKQAHSSAEANAEAVEKGFIKVVVMYPYAEGKTFDMKYYETRHMPMVAGFLGANLVKYTIEKGLSSGIPDQSLPFVAIGTFYVKSYSDYQTAIRPNRDAIRADFPHYTNISPIILVSEVIK